MPIRFGRFWLTLAFLAFASACAAHGNNALVPNAPRSAKQISGTNLHLQKLLTSIYIADIIASQGGPTPKPATTNSVFKMSSRGIACVTGIKTPLPEPSGALGCPGSLFAQPVGLAVDAAGNLYVSVSGVPTRESPKPPSPLNAPGIYKLSMNRAGATPVPVNLTISGYTGVVPYGIAVDGANPPNIYFTAAYSRGSGVFVHSGSSSSGTTTPIATGLTAPIGGVAVQANCASPCTVYVGDYGAHQVYRFTPPSKSVKSWTRATYGSGFQNPYGVAIDGMGNVYVADVANSAVKKIAPGNGTITCAFGTPAPSPTGKDVSTCPGEGEHKAHGVAVDGAGNVYIADSNHGSIKLIKAGVLYCVAPPSSTRCDGTHITPGSAGFYHPNAVAPYPYPTPTPTPAAAAP